MKLQRFSGFRSAKPGEAKRPAVGGAVAQRVAAVLSNIADARDGDEHLAAGTAPAPKTDDQIKAAWSTLPDSERAAFLGDYDTFKYHTLHGDHP